MAITKRQVLGNFLWRYFERCAAQLVSFSVSIVLARILGPTEYGTLALINVFINIFQVFAASGLGSAVVQKKDPDELDFSTVFFAQMALCLGVYAVLFFCAPLISSFYERPELTAMTRVAGISLLIFGLRNIQLSYISKKMMFKKFFFATLFGTIISAFVGILLAIKGVGTWALIAQNLTNAFVDAVLLWFTSGWRPRFIFAFDRLKKLLGFGIRNLLSSLIDTLYNNLRKLVISKNYSTSDLAYYTKGSVFPDFILINILSSINSVLYPAFSDSQFDFVRLKNMMRRSMKIEAYIITPVLMGLAACSNTIVKLILSDKWLPCVPFLQIFCLAGIFAPMGYTNVNSIHAIGRNDITLRINIITKCIGLSVLFVSMWFSVKAIAVGYLVCIALFQIIYIYPNNKIIGYTYKEQFMDIIPSFLLSFFMAAIVYFIGSIKLSEWKLLIIQIILGVIIYIGLSSILRIESYEYTKKLIMQEIRKYIPNSNLEKVMNNEE